MDSRGRWVFQASLIYILSGFFVLSKTDFLDADYLINSIEIWLSLFARFFDWAFNEIVKNHRKDFCPSRWNQFLRKIQSEIQMKIPSDA